MKKPCKYGHDVTLYNRADGRCGRCHTLRQDKYRSTPKGRKMNLDREAKRRRNPERTYYRMKWFIKTRIERKKEKLFELERTLECIKRPR